MKTYLNRTIEVDGKQVTRNVVEKNGTTTARLNNQTKEVTLKSGNARDTQAVWTLK